MNLRHSKKSHKQLGKSAIEYGLVLAAVVTIVMAGATAMKGDLNQTFTDASTAIAKFASEGTSQNVTGGGSE